MPTRSRLTLVQAFVLGFAALLALLGTLGALATTATRRSILDVAEQLRALEARRRGDAVEQAIYRVQQSLGELESLVAHGLVDVDDPAALERALLAELIRNPWLAEATFTHARRDGFEADGSPRLAAAGRWQCSAFRRDGPHGTRLVVRRVVPSGTGFVAESRDRTDAEPGDASREPDPVPDPTAHPTFQVTASEALADQVSGPDAALWTDLHYAESDASLPERERSVVVSVMKTLTGGDGRFRGVVRAALRTRQLDQAVRTDGTADEHVVVVCDERGRLVTRLDPRDPIVEQPDASLRVEPGAVPAELSAALALDVLDQVRPGHVHASGRFESDGQAFLATFRGLGRTQGWRVAIVVPEDFYLRGFARDRNRVLAVAALVLGAILLAGLAAVRAVRRGLGRIVAATARMRELDFARVEPSARFRDVADVLEGLERAKTALRAMGKYVPIDLVRRLYGSGREPELGGEVLEVTLMFTDIAGFTTLAEGVEPDTVAGWLGRYFEVMTGAVHEHGGTVDKYIGDAVMAVWNAPSPLPDHPRHACAAAIACVAAVSRLEASPEWRGRPALPTRFGLHTDRVMVGHFGAPDRLAYTALGDGVNLASRLEGLNKQYGTSILVSESVVHGASGAFEFRWLDVVAVKGRSRPVRVYELLGAAGATDPGRLRTARLYEHSLERYLARDFEAALAGLGEIGTDPPARVLAARCRRLLVDPPAADWDGSFVATSK